jgi:integrase
MRARNRLSASSITKSKAPGLYADGGGLYLRISTSGTPGWIFRYARNGKTHDHGLGRYPDVTLARAREKAADCRTALADDIDPIERRRALRADAALAGARAMTFRQAAVAYIAAHEAGWRGRDSHEQWTSSLQNYVYPVIGDLPVQAVDVGLVLKILEPIWADKTETASRVRGRIESVLDWARVRGYRSGENPARWRGHLDHLLPAKNKVKRIQHHRALPYVEIGGLVKELRAQHTIAAAALEFLILTAVRAGEGLNATWDEIDGDVWTIPGHRMKSGKEHRVPLSPAAKAVLRKMEAIKSGPYIFQGGKSDRARSRQSLRKLVHRLGRSDATVIHGLRSTFRDWCAERTTYPREVAELALAHAVGNQVERAYQRTDLFDKRRRLMADWAEFCARPVSTDSAVVPIRKRRK